MITFLVIERSSKKYSDSLSLSLYHMVRKFLARRNYAASVVVGSVAAGSVAEALSPTENNS
jgi:hypothetical protein